MVELENISTKIYVGVEVVFKLPVLFLVFIFVIFKCLGT